VAGVSLSDSFTLAVTDAGAVFSVGYSEHGTFGHSSLACGVLPRRVEALAQTGRWFLAAAAGYSHAPATAEGEHCG